jgi:hypothetical protein
MTEEAKIIRHPDRSAAAAQWRDLLFNPHPYEVI